MSNPKPKIYVFPAQFRGRPALIVHTEDEWMEEDLWHSLLMRLQGELVGAGTGQLWGNQRARGLTFVDRSHATGFRMPIQYPESLTPREAIASMVDFAPEFQWVVEDLDTSGQLMPTGIGSITISWTEVAPDDDDPMTRYKWYLETDPLLDTTMRRVVLEIAAQHVAGMQGGM